MRLKLAVQTIQKKDVIFFMLVPVHTLYAQLSSATDFWIYIADIVCACYSSRTLLRGSLYILQTYRPTFINTKGTKCLLPVDH